MNSYIQLLKLITGCQAKNFTGRVVFQSPNNISWQLYFDLGELVWLNGGIFPYRSWLRHLQKYAHHFNYDRFSIKEYRQLEFFPAASFAALSQRHLLEGASLDLMLNHRMLEIFFDILQAGIAHPLQVKFYPGLYDGFAAETLKQYCNFVNAEQLILKAQDSLNFCSLEDGCQALNLAPEVVRTENLKPNNSSIFSSKLNDLLDGKSTIRDLALKLDRDAIKLSFALLPYIRKGWLKLVEVTDIASESNADSSKRSNSLPKPLIYCVDDNALNCYLMEKIVGGFGYRFASNQQPINAIGQLIKIKPDLIFLDIVMPGIDGYTLCKSIKSISILKDIPIIMLTGEENLSAQLKAKSYGADGFISKPIIEEKIINVVRQYLAAPQAVLSR